MTVVMIISGGYGAVAEWLKWQTSVAWLLSGVIGLSQWHMTWGVGSNPTGDMAVKHL